MSTAVLEHLDTHEKVLLARDLPARTSDTNATLETSTGTIFKVRMGETFSVPGDTGTQYRVLDLREQQAILENLKDKSVVTVGRK
jgi:hypothetical protein